MATVIKLVWRRQPGCRLWVGFDGFCYVAEPDACGCCWRLWMISDGEPEPGGRVDYGDDCGTFASLDAAVSMAEDSIREYLIAEIEGTTLLRVAGDARGMN